MMELPKSRVSEIHDDIEQALPTNTSGGITAEAERTLLKDMVRKLDPLLYVTALQQIMADSMKEGQESLMVKIAKVDYKIDQNNKLLSEGSEGMETFRKLIESLKEQVAGVVQRVEVIEKNMVKISSAQSG